jgi:hypothetical protein
VAINKHGHVRMHLHPECDSALKRGSFFFALTICARESFARANRPIDVKFPFNKWFPLPNHTAIRKSKLKVNPLQAATVSVFFRTCEAKPNAETLWFETWDVPLSERLESAGLHFED